MYLLSRALQGRNQTDYYISDAHDGANAQGFCYFELICQQYAISSEQGAEFSYFLEPSGSSGWH
ncbi:hypothetical protein B0919_22185 [Hymenobacter sp. CRA2]|nr:hypothetical protein B0919_22185 [Hymenobacter sp. CRA2]